MPRKKLPARQNEPSFPQQRHANPRDCKPMKAREEMQTVNKFMENVDSQEWPESHHPGPPPPAPPAPVRERSRGLRAGSDSPMSSLCAHLASPLRALGSPRGRTRVRCEGGRGSSSSSASGGAPSSWFPTHSLSWRARGSSDFY